MADVRTIADRAAPALQSEILRMFGTLSAADQNAVTAALQTGDLGEVVRLFSLSPLATAQSTARLMAILAAVYEGGVRAAGVSLAGWSFRMLSGLSLAWLESESARLVTRISEDTRQSIRRVLTSGYVEGVGARAMGRQIRSLVGLTPDQAVAVARYTAALPPITEEARLRLTQTYARRLLALRAETIARTETMSAANAGQMAAWVEQAAVGRLDRTRVWVEWMVTEDDRLCPLCAPMDGQRIRIGDQFVATTTGFPGGRPTASGPGSERLRRQIRPDPYSRPRDAHGRFVALQKRRTAEGLILLRRPISVPYPPLHPNCRCAMVLRQSQGAIS